MHEAGDGTGAAAHPATPLSRRRMPALDGLRGLATVLVMLYHFSGDFQAGSSWLGQWTIRGLQAGWVGVDLFFVLSGFLITGILLDTAGARGYFREFYARRVLRIFPLYYVSLLLVLCLLPLLPATDALRHNQPWLWLYGTNLLVAQQGFDAVKSPWLDLGHFWTLAVEEQFYLFWPLAVLLLRGRFFALACAALAAMSVIGRYAIARYSAAPYVLTPVHLDALLIGAVLADLIRRPRAYEIVKRVAPWVGLLAVAALAVLFRKYQGFNQYKPNVQRYVYLLLAIAFGAMVVRGTAVTALDRWMTWRPLRQLGKYSYGLYVWHGLMVRALATLLPTAWIASQLQAGYVFACVARIVLFSGISLLAAWASWHAFEKHFLKLKRLFPYEQSPRSAASAAAPRTGGAVAVDENAAMAVP
jgi:peptidoglycan/LPS O-acetylase OafA/YrhL